MNPQKIKELLKETLEKDPSTVYMLTGDMGIGKTHAVRDAALEVGVPMLYLQLANEAAEDIAGIPKSGADVLSYMMPPWWDTLNKTDRGILFLDEANRAPSDIVQAVFSLIEEGKRMLRNQKIPDGWMIVVAVNPDNGFYRVNDLGPAFNRRVTHLKVEYDNEAFVAYAAKTGVHDVIVDFARAHEEMIWTDPSKVEGIPPTPAGWATVNRWIKNKLIDIENLGVMAQEMINGKVGTRAALMFKKFVENSYERFVSAKEIFEKPGFAASKELREKFFEQQEMGKNDRVTASIHSVIDYLKQDGFTKNGIPEQVLSTLKTLIKSTKFKTVNRTLLMSEIVKDNELAQALATDENLLNLVEKELESNRAKQ